MSGDAGELFLYPGEWVEDEAHDMANVARQWANKEIILNRLEYQKDYKNLCVEKNRKLGLDIGFQSLVFPEKYGGSGFNSHEKAPALLTVLSEISRADAGIGYLYALEYIISTAFAMEPHFNDSLCEMIAPVFCGQELKTASLIMPGSGISSLNADIENRDPLFLGRSIRARIIQEKKDYILTGKNLRPLGNGAHADIFCIVCSDHDGRTGVAFIHGDTKGIQISEELKKTGLDACRNADVSFDNVKVPADHIIFEKGLIHKLYSWTNLLFGAVSVGASINSFEIFSDWAENRVIKGGQMLKENPLCAAVLADVAEEITLARLLSYDLSRIIATREISDLVFTYAQMIGNRIQESAMKALNRGMELMGSAGYAKEWGVEKHWRDIKTIQSYLCGVGAEVPVKMDIARFFYGCKEI